MVFNLLKSFIQQQFMEMSSERKSSFKQKDAHTMVTLRLHGNGETILHTPWSRLGYTVMEKLFYTHHGHV